jgi:predicted RNA-binding Zn ribbon-like protein
VGRVPVDAAELTLALDFCNTYDLLNDPVEILSLDLLGRRAERAGRTDLVDGLTGAHLPALRAVRSQLYQAFALNTAGAKLEALDDVLVGAGARARIVAGRLDPVAGPDPVDRLAATLAGALARAIIDGDPTRLRLCAGDPCRCVYVDRTRANRQRYCCELCNDRMAARAYRSRRT